MSDERSYEGSYEPRVSARKSDVVIEVRPERRRTWNAAEKLEIMRQALEPGAVAAHVMLRHGISSSSFYTWRKQAMRAAPAGFLAVQIEKPLAAQAAATTPPTEMPGDGVIEIFLSGEVSVRVDRGVDARALGVVLKAIRA